MEVVAIAGAVIGGVSSIAGGFAQQDMYDAQARHTMLQAKSTELQFRQNALGWKEEAIEVLKKTRRNLAAVNARGSAANINPYSGSTGNLFNVNLSEGLQDFDTAVTNEAIELENINMSNAMAQHQANMYYAAGRQAKNRGIMEGLSSFGSAGMGAYNAGWFGGSTAAVGGGGSTGFKLMV